MTGQSKRPSTPPEVPDFRIVMRGYDRGQVDDFIARHHATEPGGILLPNTAEFPIRFRGYARDQVEAYIHRYITKR